jgi:hypothetical protein
MPNIRLRMTSLDGKCLKWRFASRSCYGQRRAELIPKYKWLQLRCLPSDFDAVERHVTGWLPSTQRLCRKRTWRHRTGSSFNFVTGSRNNFLIYRPISTMSSATWPPRCPLHDRKFENAQTGSRNNFLIYRPIRLIFHGVVPEVNANSFMWAIIGEMLISRLFTVRSGWYFMGLFLGSKRIVLCER